MMSPNPESRQHERPPGFRKWDIHILKYLKFLLYFLWSLSNPVALARYNLFTCRN